MQFSCSTALSCFICCLLSDCSIIIMAITTSWESAQWGDCLLTQSPAYRNISQFIGCFICITIWCFSHGSCVLAWISPLAATSSSECGQDTVAMQLFHVPIFLPNTSLYAYCRCIVFWWITLCSRGKKQQKEVFAEHMVSCIWIWELAHTSCEYFWPVYIWWWKKNKIMNLGFIDVYWQRTFT